MRERQVQVWTERRKIERPGWRWLSGAMASFAILSVSGCDAVQSPSSHPSEGPRVLASSEVHVVGSSSSLATVRDLEVIPDGSVWVLNSVEPFFVGFGPEGDPLGEWGTMGGGPEEFGAPSGFVTGGIHGEAWVFDNRRHSMIKISGQISQREEIPLPRGFLPPGSLIGGMGLMSPTVRTAHLGEEILVARTTRPEGSDFFTFVLSILGADVLAMHTGTQSVRDVMALGDVLGDLTVGFEPTEGGLPLWYRLWAVCGGDRISVHDRVRNEVRSFNPDGIELEATPLPSVRLTEVTPRQFARAVFRLRQAEAVGDVRGMLTPADSARLLNEMVQSIKGNPQQLAGYLPRYVDFRCTEKGTMWLRHLDPDLGDLAGGKAWFRITPDGETKEFLFPDRFDPYRFGSERIWGVQRDELDVASVAWIEIPGNH